MHQMQRFPILGERERLLPKTRPINKDYKSFELDINSYLI